MEAQDLSCLYMCANVCAKTYQSGFLGGESQKTENAESGRCISPMSQSKNTPPTYRHTEGPAGRKSPRRYKSDMMCKRERWSVGKCAHSVRARNESFSPLEAPLSHRKFDTYFSH